LLRSHTRREYDKWIEGREDGLTIRTLFRRQSILWEEARLFAIDAIVKTTEAPNRYELFGATTMLRWSRELTPSPWTRLSSPFPEYSQQVDGLLALIAGKTGLPLYDLRDWEAEPQPAPPYLPPPLPPYPPPFSPDEALAHVPEG
jgi:hypothetical protein